MESEQAVGVTVESAGREQVGFINRAYGWMCAGLGLTAVVAYIVASTPALYDIFLRDELMFYGLLFAEVILVILFTKAMPNLTYPQTVGAFLLYALMNGLTFSVIFAAYTATSIGLAFLVTAGTFGAMCAYGFATKKDLTSAGSIALTGLVGIILASLANFWLRSPQIDWIVTYAGIAIFVVLIAVDAQKIKALNEIGNEGSERDKKESVAAALAVYLDFINLFLKLLRVLGKRK